MNPDYGMVIHRLPPKDTKDGENMALFLPYSVKRNEMDSSVVENPHQFLVRLQ